MMQRGCAMKKSRRILMLVLALVMVFTVVAIPASAAEVSSGADDTVEVIVSLPADVVRYLWRV